MRVPVARRVPSSIRGAAVLLAVHAAAVAPTRLAAQQAWPEGSTPAVAPVSAPATPSAAPLVGIQADATTDVDALVGRRVQLILRDVYRQQAWPPAPQRLRGELTRASRDSLYLAVPPATGALAVAPADVRAVYVSRGRPSRLRTAVDRGGTFGFLTAAALAAAAYNGTERPKSVRRNVRDAAWAGLGFGVVVGGSWGILQPAERWRRVPDAELRRAQR